MFETLIPTAIPYVGPLLGKLGNAGLNYLFGPKKKIAKAITL